MLGQERDALERIVRVLPESLMHTRMISNVVAHKTYTSELIDIPLDFGSEPELDSIVIDFSVTRKCRYAMLLVLFLMPVIMLHPIS